VIRRRTRLAACAMLTAALSVSLALTVPAVLAADGSVTMEDFAFSPATVTVGVSDSVTWTNNDSADHTSTADDGSFDTESIGNGESSTLTFQEAGSFAYHCTIHPAMHGTVVVEAAAGGGGGTTLTPAPTDTLPATSAAPDDPTVLIAVLLAVLGGAMVLGTWALGRRDRPAS
jgi:plastocyanin